MSHESGRPPVATRVVLIVTLSLCVGLASGCGTEKRMTRAGYETHLRKSYSAQGATTTVSLTTLTANPGGCASALSWAKEGKTLEQSLKRNIRALEDARAPSDIASLHARWVKEHKRLLDDLSRVVDAVAAHPPRTWPECVRLEPEATRFETQRQDDVQAITGTCEQIVEHGYEFGGCVD